MLILLKWRDAILACHFHDTLLTVAGSRIDFVFCGYAAGS